MANITGTTQRERIDSRGVYFWDGLQWVLRSASGTTAASDTVRAGAGNDEFDGGGGNDFLYGDAGNDTILGGAGYDRLEGGTGNDRLEGGASLDDLFGGTGSDIFAFGATSDSAAVAGAFSNDLGDFIGDFTSITDTTVVANRDKIDLTGLVAAAGRAISFSSVAAANGAWVNSPAGGRSFLMVDTTGDAVADFSVMFNAIETLTAQDFIGLSVAAGDVTPPARPTIDLDASSDTGASSTDNVTTATSLLIRGNAEAGSTVRLFDGALQLGQTTASASGTYSLTTPALAVGGHSLTATAADAAGNVSQASTALSVTIETSTTPPTTQVRDVRVASGVDDAEQNTATGQMYLTSSDLELGTDPTDWGSQLVGLRFDNLGIPVGATITRAWLQFAADEAQSVATNVTIQAQLSLDAASFTAAANNISSRPLTSSSVTLVPISARPI
jgi:hypothetical protein